MEARRVPQESVGLVPGGNLPGKIVRATGQHRVHSDPHTWPIAINSPSGPQK